MLRSLEQDRAKYGWQKVIEVRKQNNPGLSEKYLSYVEGSATLILTNGLGNALAFFRSKFGSKKNRGVEEQAYQLLYDHINGWFSKQRGVRDLLDWVVNQASSIDVLQETKETLALINWLKRFSNAELKST